MRAIAAFPSEKKLNLVDRPSPRIERDTDVRLRVLEVGTADRHQERHSVRRGAPGMKG
jgi:hypothetical protein